MIRFTGVTFGYEHAESSVIRRANFQVSRGEFVLVCGPTGSGKSTLLKLLNGLAPNFTGGVLSGSITIDGEEVLGKKPQELAELVGYVNQQPEGSFVADTVGEELAYGLEQLGFEPAEMEKRVAKYAALVGVETLIEQPLAALSGGQQQRVAIARALITQPALLLADEPTGNLDTQTAAEMFELFRKVHREHDCAVLLVTHDPRLSATCDRTINLVDGRIQSDSKHEME
mgnify:CR=1 FL=1